MASLPPPSLAETLAHAQGIIFDIDGVLLDSLTSGEALFCATATELGLPADDRTKRAFHRLWGMAARKMIPACWPDRTVDVEAFYRQWQQYDQTSLHPLLPGVTTALPQLATCKVLSIFTNREESTAQRQLNGHGIAEHFRYAVFLANEPYPKPHPLSISRLLAKYSAHHQLRPNQLLYCGDSLDNDLPVARAHGIPFVAVLGGRHTKSDFLGAGVPASHIVNHVGEIIPHLST